ncbi:hypothetical protein [Paludibaculum fermentans]|uniref:hypothetical protein n=1 Tax=Paludibaculum fermentans TaxID=1473598 RepID=UPI003EBE0AFF
MPIIHYGRALYYPHIFPKDRVWLRTAALYHDGISRIVPKSFVASKHKRYDSIKLLQDFEALQDSGFIEDEAPTFPADDSHESFRRFLDLVRQRRVVQPGPQRTYSMFIDKMDRALFDELREVGLAIERDAEIEMPEDVGLLYMTFLAKHMAGHRPILTDNPAFQTADYVPLPPEGGGPHSDVGFVLATAVMRTALPVDIQSIPISDLIQFREDHTPERAAFYDAISNLARDLQVLRPGHELEKAIEHHNSVLQLKIKALESKLRLLNITCISGVLSMSLPSYWVSDWGLHLANPAFLVGGGALIASFMALRCYLERVLTTAENPAAYVHYMQSQLTPAKYTEQFLQLHLS